MIYLKKIENPFQFKRLKTYILDSKLDLSIIYECENAILNKINWKVNLLSCYELGLYFIEILQYKDIGIHNNNDDIISISEIISFCIMEYEIYQKYDLYVITLSSLIFFYKVFKNHNIFKYLNTD